MVAGLVGFRIGELDVDLTGVFDGVFGHQRADSSGYTEEEFIGFLGRGVVVFSCIDWVGGFNNRGSFVMRSTRETLP